MGRVQTQHPEARGTCRGRWGAVCLCASRQSQPPRRDRPHGDGVRENRAEKRSGGLWQCPFTSGDDTPHPLMLGSSVSGARLLRVVVSARKRGEGGRSRVQRPQLLLRGEPVTTCTFISSGVSVSVIHLPVRPSTHQFTHPPPPSQPPPVSLSSPAVRRQDCKYTRSSTNWTGTIGWW